MNLFVKCHLNLHIDITFMCTLYVKFLTDIYCDTGCDIFCSSLIDCRTIKDDMFYPDGEMNFTTAVIFCGLSRL